MGGRARAAAATAVDLFHAVARGADLSDPAVGVHRDLRGAVAPRHPFPCRAALGQACAFAYARHAAVLRARHDQYREPHRRTDLRVGGRALRRGDCG